MMRDAQLINKRKKRKENNNQAAAAAASGRTDGRAVYKYFVSDQSHLVSFYSSGYYPSTTGLSIVEAEWLSIWGWVSALLLLLLCHCNDILAAAAASQHYFEEKIALLSYSYIRLGHDRRKEGNKKKKRKQGTRLPFFSLTLISRLQWRSIWAYRLMVCRVSEDQWR